MRRSYVLLSLAVIALAIGLTLAGRAFRPRRGGDVAPPAAAPTTTRVTIEIRGGGIEPATVSVPKGRRVLLTVVNHDPGVTRLTLSGYEDQVPIPPLLPEGRWTGAFLADRPGEDFAWLLDGVPTGRFAVTGSHLMDGHR